MSTRFSLTRSIGPPFSVALRQREFKAVAQSCAAGSCAVPPRHASCGRSGEDPTAVYPAALTSAISDLVAELPWQEGLLTFGDRG